MSNLVIVESPAKAKTIEGYLGKDFKVVSCNGHIRDLPKKNKGIDIEKKFEPTYIINEEKEHVVKELKKLSKKAEVVYLASDDDREGESIAWHLKEALELKDEKIRRIVFREITKKAILKAIESPRNINFDLVHAQQARRVLDRLVGYDLSPVLWTKIKSGLSAGRVQSVAVRMISEREREVFSFEPKASFKVTAQLNTKEDKLIKAELSDKFKEETSAMEFLENCKGATFTVTHLEKKASKKSPTAPFTTSTLQQEASRKLGYSVSQTMRLAQRLYEEGKISYMRTDSVHLSEEAIQSAKKEIFNAYGEDHFHERHYKTKSSGAQEAHEAVRPTNFSKKEVSSDHQQQKLYELIWRRAIASQMADAQLERTTATISISGIPNKNLIAKGEVITFKGFLEVYLTSTEEEPAGILPPLKKEEVLNLESMQARERFTKPPARFAEATLVRELEERGIGRPSTYAPTISTIQQRGYVIKESRDGKERDYRLLTLKDDTIKAATHKEIVGTEKNKLFPTDIAMVVNDFLVKHFPNITNYDFTAKIEEKLDNIAHHEQEWNAMIGDFYKDFHPKVEETSQIDRTEINTSRELGVDPKSGKPVSVRLGKYGPFVQIGSKEEDEKPQYASLHKDQLMEKITLEEALELFKLPRDVGSFEGSMISANIGRFGPYVKHENKFYSLGKEDDPLTIELEPAIEIIQAKRKAEAERIIKTFDENPDIQVLNGRYGPYIKAGKKNVKIPKDQDPKSLTLAQCVELAENSPTKKRSFKKK